MESRTLKQFYESLYKRKPHQRNSTSKRAETVRLNRKSKRQSLINRNRQLDQSGLNVTGAPTPKTDLKAKVEERKAKLEEWIKKKKELKTKVRSTSRPLFKVSTKVDHRADLALYAPIEKKPDRKIAKVFPKSSNVSLSIRLNNQQNNKNEKKNPKKSGNDQNASNVVPMLVSEETVDIGNVTNEVVATKRKKNRISKADLAAANQTPIRRSARLSQKSSAKATKISNEEPIEYLSPYVTVSRGKREARDEFLQNRANLPNEVQEMFSPAAGAKYFRKKLNDEIAKIDELCKQWESYKESESPSEDGCDLINMAIGQSRLLISKKFKQFERLIERCEEKNLNEKPVTSNDLHGFWDMMHKQIEDVEARFVNLEEMSRNDWLHITPEPKARKKAIGKKMQKQKKTGPSSAIKRAMRAARENMKENMCKFCPEANDESLKKTPRVIIAGETPGKSILKSNKSASKVKRSVVFQEILSDRDNASPNRRGTPRRSRAKLFD